MKDFRQHLQKTIFTKQESTKDIEIERLKSEAKQLKHKVQELKNVLAQEENLNEIKIHISEIKLKRNIRDFYDYEDIESLMENTKELGQLQPCLVTLDNILISGHRRYLAIENLHKAGKHDGFLMISIYPKNYSDMGSLVFDRIQYFENEQRKPLDNFQLGKLFAEYIEEGYSQLQLTIYFNKHASGVSRLISIHNNILPEIKDLLREIQYYGYSKAKFEAGNYKKESKILGINILTDISRNTDKFEQIEVFLKIFGSKLTQEEIHSFGIIHKEKHFNHIKLIKQFSSRLNKKIKDLRSEIEDPEKLLKLEKAEILFQDFEKIIKEFET